MRRQAPVGPYFTPAQLPGLVLWLRADLGITLNGASVSAWADQSGNGNNASQATPTNQPAYHVNGGANNTPYLAHGGSTWLTAPLITTQSANFTMFTVAQASSLITRNDVFEVGSAGHNYGLFVNSDGSRRTNVNGASSAKFGTATTNWEKWCWYDTSGVNNTTRVNGVPITASGNVAITTPTGVTNIGTFSDGSPDVWSGGIAEILFYSTTLSIAQILQVEAYLLARYGV